MECQEIDKQRKEEIMSPKMTRITNCRAQKLQNLGLSLAGLSLAGLSLAGLSLAGLSLAGL